MNPNTLDTKLHIILDNIRSAYNVGSIFRTADGTGCAKLHICGISPHPPNIKLEKTALGSLDTVSWCYENDTVKAIKKLTKQDIPVYSIELSPTSIDYRKVFFPSPVALVLGHEINGISHNVLKASDKIVHIPMRGSKSSLNVATVAGIIMYEAIRNYY